MKLIIRFIKYLIENYVYILFPKWDLRLWTVWPWVYRGPENKERIMLINKLLSKYTKDKKKHCLQVGVPSNLNKKYGDNFTSIDLYDPRECIDYKCDLAKTPFKSNEFDFILCAAILEHVRDPFACAKELYRIAAPGAEILVEVPFVQCYHPHKNWNPKDGYGCDSFSKEYKSDEEHGGDYWRFTPQGIILMMKPFKLKKILLINYGSIAFYGIKEN